jgi:hypothetical protein
VVGSRDKAIETTLEAKRWKRGWLRSPTTMELEQQKGSETRRCSQEMAVLQE